MARHSCRFCHAPIASGEGVIRSINFVLAAWHPECYDLSVVQAPEELPRHRAMS